MLDDAHRPRYRSLFDELTGWKPEVFAGTAPYSFGLTCTVIWTSREEPSHWIAGRPPRSPE